MYLQSTIHMPTFIGAFLRCYDWQLYVCDFSTHVHFLFSSTASFYVLRLVRTSDIEPSSIWAATHSIIWFPKRWDNVFTSCEYWCFSLSFHSARSSLKEIGANGWTESCTCHHCRTWCSPKVYRRTRSVYCFALHVNCFPNFYRSVVELQSMINIGGPVQ